MRFSFVAVNYASSWGLIEECLDSVVRDAKSAGVEFEFIVVDNDPPGHGQVLPRATVVESGRNIGFARAVNRGIRASSGAVIVLINPDSVVQPGFFRKMAGHLAENPEVGVAGPRILDADGSVQLSARRDFSLLSGLFGRTSLLTRLFPNSGFARSQFSTGDETSGVDWVSGACMAIRREVFERVGLLDERFFMYFEDADLCRRARGAGFGVEYVPAATVVHDAGGSTRSRPLAVLRLHRSAFIYHLKHGERGPLRITDAAVFVGLSARAAVGIARGFIRR